MVQVWQIAAGTSDRNYSDIFTKYDLMLLGPGYYGDYNDNKLNYIKDKEYTVRAFVEKVQPGDVILLRVSDKIVDIGIAHDEGYSWRDIFEDVYGWPLQHVRRVIWQDKEKELANIQEKMGNIFSNKRYNSFSGVDSNKLRNSIKTYFEEHKVRDLKHLPARLPDKLTLDELGQELFSRGLSNENVEKLIHSIQRLRRLNKWYQGFGKKSGRPAEHEVVAHLILPILISLGWSEQLLAIEWNKIDLAAFSGTPTTKDNCILICEAKGMGHGLQGDVFLQAKKYIDKFVLTNCMKIILAEGTRIYIYDRKDNTWAENPSGYINFNNIRTNHIAPENTNAIDTIMSLTPSGVLR